MIRLILALVFVVSSCVRGETPRALTILHVNDLHARFLPDEEGRGGFARVAAALRREGAGQEGFLVLSGGDLVQGTPVSTLFDGLPCFEVANAMGIDVHTLGNHEFDYGWKRILDFVKTARFPIVSSNVVDETGGLLAPQAYVIRRVNGIRVAVIGALTAELPRLTKTAQRGHWKVLPVAETVRRYARELRERSDLVVVVSHIFDSEEDEILRSVPEVPVIVSGHNHGGQEEVKQVEGRLCVKVKGYGREVGRLDLKVDVAGKRVAEHQWRRIPIDAARVPADARVQKLVDHWEARVAEKVDVEIGQARRVMAREDLAGIAEQVMRDVTGADIAYMNRGGIRDSLRPGKILARHIWNIFPFDNQIVTGRLRGSQIPAEAMRGRPIDANREYLFATNDFTADQWKKLGLTFSEDGPELRKAVIDWIREKKVIR